MKEGNQCLIKGNKEKSSLGPKINLRVRYKHYNSKLL